MSTRNIRSVNLIGAEEAVQFDNEFKGYKYYWVNNISESDVLASVYSGITDGADGVVKIKPGTSCGTMHEFYTDTVYLKGAGEVQVAGTLEPVNPFKTSWKGGVDGSLSKAGYAADSKAVGEKLKVLQDVINGVTHRFVTDNTTAYSKSVPAGAKIASVNKVGGRTVCFNQMQAMPTIDNTTNISQHSNVVIDSVIDGKITVTDNGDNDTRWGLVQIGETTSGIVGHKYYCRATFTIEQNGGQKLFYVFGNPAATTSNIVSANLNVTAIPQTVSIIGTCNKTSDIWGYLQFKMGGITFSVENIMCFDLTKMFGTGNEPATVEEFETMFPEIYYPYDKGTLMASPVTAFNSIIDGRIIQTNKMPSTVLALDGYGDGINDNVYNYVDFETNTYHKCVGSVDLGTLNWVKYTLAGSSNTFKAPLPNLSSNVNNNNGICGKYDVGENNGITDGSNNGIWLRNNTGEIYLSDSAYTDVETFKAAVSGVMIYYGINDCVVTDITDMFPADFNIMNTMTGGKIVFENENKIAVPNEVEYIVDLAEVIAND